VSELDDLFGDIFDNPVIPEPEPIPVVISPVEQAKQDKEDIHNKLTAIRTEEEELKAAMEVIRKQYEASMETLRAKQAAKNALAQAYRDAERKITEAEHLENERRKEEEANARRASVVAGFKEYMDELKPAYLEYAFDHQWEGATTLGLHGSGLLADDMGLGKTLTAIMWLDMVRANRVLIVTPSDTCNNFTIEMMMWAKHRFTWTLANQNAAGRRAFLDALIIPRVNSGDDITITINYEQLQNEELMAELIEMKFDTIIIDEAHNFKNKKGKLFQQLKRLARHGEAKHILPMTGTFILNAPQDIWPALHLIDPEAFPTENTFLNWYCTMDYYTNKWVFKSGGVTSMMKRLGGRIVMRTMEEAGIKLPTQHIHEEILEFNSEDTNHYSDQRRIIKMLAENAQIILDSERKTSIIEQIALITRQRQAIVWPAGITLTNPEGDVVFSVGEEVQESIKMDWVETKIRSLTAEGKRVAVFSQFKTGLAELEKRFSGSERVVRYDGDTKDNIKTLVKQDFDRRHVDKNNGEYLYDVVLCNFKTGGVGLNFTHATEMIMLDEEWNPGKNEQAYRRTKRIGQTEETHVYIPRVRKSIDTWMKALNDRKSKLVDGFNLEVDMEKDFHNFLEVIKNG
jgi:SNF2 family DNA or RNA helicase